MWEGQKKLCLCCVCVCVCRGSKCGGNGVGGWCVVVRWCVVGVGGNGGWCVVVGFVEMVEMRNTCAEKGGFGCVGTAKKLCLVRWLVVGFVVWVVWWKWWEWWK